MKQISDYKTIVKAELVRRADKNPRYSLRAMARALGLAPGVFSQVLSGKRIPSYKMALKIAGAIDLAPDEQREFFRSLTEIQKARRLKRVSPAFRRQSNQRNGSTNGNGNAHANGSRLTRNALAHAGATRNNSHAPKDLSLEIFRAASDWYHYAILMLTYVKNFDPNPNWIAAQLGITPLEAKLAVERLLELELLKRQGRTLVSWQGHFTTADKHITNSALKLRHKQILDKSRFSLENDAIEARNHSTMTMAIDPAKIGKAKEMVEEFTNRLCEFLESGKRLQVYELNIGLFPLQKQKREIGS